MQNYKNQPWDEKWEIGAQLGEGGQGETFHATRKSNPDLKAVLKKLRHNDSPQARGRMNREVASLELLFAEEGAVPQVYDHNTHDHKNPDIDLYMVMELIQGDTLDKIINSNGPLSFEEATRITLKLCETITLAHNNVILHRDLKPENIIIRDLVSGDVVIIDYGLSFNADDPSELTRDTEHLWNAFFTLPATTVPGGNRKDPRVDVAAVCALYHYLLTGKIPVSLTDDNGLLPHQRPNCSVRETIENDALSSQLDVLFNQGFAVDVDFRFQTIEEFMDRVKSLKQGAHASQIEDPISVAKHYSSILIKKDRKIQLIELQPKAKDLQKQIAKFVSTYHGKLNRFTISQENVSRNEKLGHCVPQGFDNLLPQNFQITINPAHHSHFRSLMFTFASEGNQCVIMCKRFKRSGSEPNSQISEWKELVWYDTETMPSLDIIKEEIQIWMNDSIEKLVDLFN